jgi:hypothetical protein
MFLALPSGPVTIWTEQHPLGSSVSGYLSLEGQGPNNTQTRILQRNATYHSEVG